MKSVIILILFFVGTFTACSVLTLTPANFAWPIESVLKVNDEGEVNDERYSFSFDAKGIYHEEFQDSLAYLDRELRIIRDVQGYYFMTGIKFKNVYRELKGIVNEKEIYNKPFYNFTFFHVCSIFFCSIRL